MSFSSEESKSLFLKYLNSTIDYGDIYDYENISNYLSSPFVISDFFPFLTSQENYEIDENGDEDISIISHPSLPLSIQNLKLKENSIVVAKHENSICVCKITNLPFVLSSKSWVDCLEYAILSNKSLHVKNSLRVRLDKILFTIKLKNGKIVDADYKKIQVKKKTHIREK